MIWIEFSDIIGIAITVYVAVLAFNNHQLKNDVKKGFLFSGMMLAILYILDMVWYILCYNLPISQKTDFILNVVACALYLMIPVGLSTFFGINAIKRGKVRHYIGLFSNLLLAIMDIANIFTPIAFYHKDSVMYYTPFGLIMHIVCFGAFIILLGDMFIATSFDHEDYFLAAFVGINMLLGLLASWINYDLKTLWMGLGIAYLLMYLAVAELYNKKDVITDLPNRNAYEKAMSYIKNNYNAILMIDMNGLKTYNDTMGHKTGDKYIYATARSLADAYEGCGKLYRVGGDEFCLISNKSKEELEDIAKALLEKGRCDEKYGDFKLDFAYGVGVREPGDTPEDVYGKADILMYENKKKNKR